VSKISLKKIKHVKTLYFQDGRMPIKIYRMTGIPYYTVLDIIKGKHNAKIIKKN
jgi:hypothetical protein